MATDILDGLSRRIRSKFEEDRQVLSFAQYLELFREAPRQHGRSVAQYMRDMFDHYGTEQVERPYGSARRFRLFDGEFNGGHERLVGQEVVQNRVYSALRSFVHQRRVNKLILLHGPNGSAKSTFIHCLMRGMENYSQQPEGAVYRFNWVFPNENIDKKGIGFGGEGGGGGRSMSSWAHLSEENVDARIAGDVSDPPIFLIPKDERRALLNDLVPMDDDQFVWSDYILNGELSHTSQRIFEALLVAYQGDYGKVLQHVQVERLYVSQRYRRSAVTIEPQLRVDASVRQVTMDRSMQSLPPALQNMTLYEPFGDLVDANRGILEFNDLFKRPLEAFKYILSTCEKSTVTLDNCILFLDSFFIGSANEKHLMAFKELPDFQAFQGRLELIRVPYLRDHTLERRIYTEQIEATVVDTEVAPHTTTIAALWAVLTRLKKPQPERFDKSLRDVVSKLTPLEKAELYATGRTPEALPTEQANELKAHIGELWAESDSYPNYEGLLGASPREIKTLLLNAAQNREHACISPLSFIEELEALVEDRTTHEFLQFDPQGDFHDPKAFIGVVREVYLDLIHDELREATGLVAKDSYFELFRRYVNQVKHHVSNEKVENPLTGKFEDPDREFMADVEGKLAIVGSPDAFRHQFFNRIGAWGHEHPGQVVDLEGLFARELEQLRESYYSAQRQTLSAIFEAVLRLSDDGDDGLDADSRAMARHTLDSLTGRFGYGQECAREAISFLLKHRYPD